MADSYIKVLESQDPDAKQVDNESVDYSGDTRYRQRVAVPDGADVAQGAVGDAAWSSGDGTVISLLKKLAGLLAGTLTVNASGTPVPVTDNSSTLSVDDGAGSLTVDGSVTVTQGTATNLKVDASSVAVPVTDNSGSLTVDDGGSSLTVDGTVGVSGTVTVDSELTTADLDTGAGTDTRAVVGLVIAKSGGAANISASDPMPVSDAGGTLSVDDGAGSLTVDQATPASLMAVAYDTTDLIYNASTALTPKFKVISASSSGVNTAVAAVTSKKIRVLSYVIVASAAVNVKWQSHTAGDITGLSYLAANGGVVAPHSPYGHFETTAGEALDINLSAANAVGGHLVYVEV